MPVLDASVCVALFNDQEPGHRAATTWLAEAKLDEEPIVAPAILLAEVAAALARHAGDPASSMAAIELLRNGRILDLFPVDERLAARAAVIAAVCRLRGADAIYVALADRLAMTLITYDSQQLERAPQLVPARQPAPRR